MKQPVALAGFQAAFTLLQVYLISKISTIGKIGIAVFYKEYQVFRSGWKTFLLFFGVQLLWIAALYLVQKRAPRSLFKVCIVFLLVALAGLWLTYNDFMYTYSHRLLKERFHLGIYLFWAGLLVTTFSFMLKREKLPAAPDEQSNAE